MTFNTLNSATMLTTNRGPILTPEQVSALVVQPFMEQAVALQVSTAVPLQSGALRVPIVTEDAHATWTDEGTEIEVSDPKLDEITVAPRKLAALVVLSNELAADSTPAALQIVGDSLVRDLARKADEAFFGDGGPGAPDGLTALAGVNPVTGAAGNLDWVADAIGNAARRGARVDAFVVHPDRWTSLAQIKEGTTSARPLINPDPVSPTGNSLAGVPVYVSPAVAEDTAWAIPRRHSLVAVRQDTSLQVDASPFFTSDRTGVRAIMRVGFGFPFPGAVSKVTFAK